jgi:TrmH family RNA methyltransferase
MNPSKKLIESLKEKKYRYEKGMFVVEGEKSVVELLESDFEVVELYGVKTALNRHHHLHVKKHAKVFDLEPGEMRALSTLEDNQGMLAVAKIPQSSLNSNHPSQGETLSKITSGIILALDGIKDPGNLGTIMRIADWYGIHNIVVSEDTVDTWNTKTIAASMGSFTRVTVTQTNIFKFLESTKLPIYGADMRGSNVHKVNFPTAGILLIGSESKGISGNLDHLIKEKITIPKYGKAESLNAAIATAVILDNWKR